MKKYITLAALLSAGAAFANAAEIVQEFDLSNGNVTLTTPVDLTQNWTLEFTLAPFKPETVTWDAWGDTLVSLGANQGTDIGVNSLPYWGGETNPEITKYYSEILIVPVGEVVECNWSLIPTHDFATAFTLKYDSGTLTFDISSEWTGSVYSATYEGVTFTQTEANFLSSTIYAAGVPTPTVKITSTVIPEPSAFGLLAGLGALALVGTRRRRK